MIIRNIDKKKQKILVICIFYSLTLILTGCIINGSPDTYTVIRNTNSAIRLAFRNGRFTLAIFTWIIGILSNISISLAFYISMLISTVLFIFAEYRYSLFLIKHLHDDRQSALYMITFFSCITLLNVFSAEYFMFPDANPSWALAIYANVKAIVCFDEYLSLHQRGKFVHTLFLLGVVVFSYQILLSAFVVLALPIIVQNSQSIKSLIIKQFSVGILYIIPMLTNLIFTKFIMSNIRAEGDQNSISQAVSAYVPLGKTPSQFILDRISLGMWVYAFLCTIVAVYLVYKAIRANESIEIFKGIYISSITIIMGLLPYIAKISDNYSPRIYYPLGMLLGILLIYALQKEYITPDCYSLIQVIIIISFFNQLFANVQIFTDRYVTNYEDKYLSQIYGQRIQEYEEKSGNEIQYVCFYQDAIRTKYIRNSGWCVSMRVYGVNWGNTEALNYYLGTNYKTGMYDESIANTFAKNNWDCYSEEQIIFTGDTAHICRY